MTSQTALQARYNGGMLGFFLSAAPLEHTRARYPVLRARINQFLEEIGALPVMPPEQPTPDATARLMQEVVFAVRMCDDQTGTFALIAGLATFHAIFHKFDSTKAAQCRDAAIPLLENAGLPTKPFHAFAEAVEYEQDGSIAIDPLHSAGLTFLKSLIDPLDVCERTVFVAMPFQPPHDAYFSEFYQPILASMDLAGIRAWGGLSSENYQEIIHGLIRKSAYVLADLTTLNINVVHEVGLAEGMQKTTFLIAARDEVLPPSNLADLAIVRYQRPDAASAEEQIAQVSTVLSLGRYGAENG